MGETPMPRSQTMAFLNKGQRIMFHLIQYRSIVLLLLVGLGYATGNSSIQAQAPQPQKIPQAQIRSAPIPPHSGIRVEAVSGKPYGVAQIMIPAGQIVPHTSVRLIVTNAESRLFFPAVDIVSTSPPPAEIPPVRIGANRPRIGALVERIRGAVNAARNEIDPPEIVRLQFLFVGDSPFTVSISGDLNESIEVRPMDDVTSRNAGVTVELLRASWWEGYVAQAKEQVERSDYPAIIENYLIHMLGRRFDYPIPELSKKPPSKQTPQEDPLPTIALVAGVESLRAELHRETLNQTPLLSDSLHPIPSPPNWTELVPPAVPEDLAVEAIAHHVPPECFYIRFGSFGNFLWYKQFGESRGGDLAQLAVLRGLNYQTNARMERMLNSKTTFVGKLFGDSVIADMAIIGQDLYMQEGPTMGILFEAKNINMLRSSMESERKAALKQYEKEGAKLETMEIAGSKVTLLSTPDNQVRSFMVERGKYLMLTTSRTMAQRFLEVEEGAPSLADSHAFRFARLTMPTANDYSVFVYLSSEFFRNLVSPQYQIELRRRLKAIASIEIAEMATYVAKAEAVVREESFEPSVERLQEAGYLPPSFQSRIDGSQTLRYNDRWHDSLRGGRGSFLPIADVPLVDCTTEESLAYQKQAEFYAKRWQQTDPIMLGIRRFAHPEMANVENLVFEGYIAPLGREKYGWVSTLLGEPVQTEIELPKDDMLNVQLHLSGDTPLGRHGLNHVLFAGVKDMVPPVPGETQGLFATLRVLKSVPGYIGTWPSPGYLDRLPFGLGGGRPDLQGFSRTLFGLWRWQGNGFSIASFDRGIIEQCVQLVHPIPAKDFAQGRLFIGDLKRSQVASFFNVLSFRRAAQASRGNLMLLDAIQDQLHILPGDALRTAEQLLDAQLQCPLGGKYTLVHPDAPESRSNYWTSTMWEASIGAAVPESSNPIGFDPDHALPANDYRVPWLEWFRGAHLHLTQLPERLVLVGELSMERMEPTERSDRTGGTEEKLPSMNLDLFNLPFQFFQGDKPKAKKDSATEGAGSPKPGATRGDF